MRYATGRRAVLVRCLLAAVAAFILAGTAAPALADGGGGGGGGGPAPGRLTGRPARVAGGASAPRPVPPTPAPPAAPAVAVSRRHLHGARGPPPATPPP